MSHFAGPKPITSIRDMWQCYLAPKLAIVIICLCPLVHSVSNKRDVAYGRMGHGGSYSHFVL